MPQPSCQKELEMMRDGKALVFGYHSFLAEFFSSRAGDSALVASGNSQAALDESTV